MRCENRRSSASRSAAGSVLGPVEGFNLGTRPSSAAARISCGDRSVNPELDLRGAGRARTCRRHRASRETTLLLEDLAGTLKPGNEAHAALTPVAGSKVFA